MTRTLGTRLIVAMSLSVGFTSAVRAELGADWFKGHEKEWAQCAPGPTVTDDQRIAGCTAIIKAGKAEPVYLSAAYAYRGALYSKRRDFGRAITDFDQTIRLRPVNGEKSRQADRADAFDKRGYAYASKGDLDRGIRDFSEAIRLLPGDKMFSAPYVDRGEAYFFQKKYPLAKRDLDVALQLGPRNARALYFRAQTKEKMGDNAGAGADLAAARAINPKIGQR